MFSAVYILPPPLIKILSKPKSKDKFSLKKERAVFASCNNTQPSLLSVQLDAMMISQIIVITAETPLIGLLSDPDYSDWCTVDVSLRATSFSVELSVTGFLPAQS